jgi:hypothetical protein
LISVRDERNSLTPLVEKGLVARPRVLQLERTGDGLEGQVADARANIARARQAIAEQMIVHGDVMQVSADRLTDVKTGNPYFIASIRIDENELAELPNIRHLSRHAGIRHDPDDLAHRIRLSDRPAGDVV